MAIDDVSGSSGFRHEWCSWLSFSVGYLPLLSITSKTIVLCEWRGVLIQHGVDAVQKIQIFDGVRQNSSTLSAKEKNKPSGFGGESWSASDRSWLDRTRTKNTQRGFGIRACERNEFALVTAHPGSRAENDKWRP